MSISRHISPITPYQSPGSSEDRRPPKRQRVENDNTSNGYGSPDELELEAPLQPIPSARPRPLDTQTGRPPARNGSQSHRHNLSENEDLDELGVDHDFFLRGNSSHGHAPPIHSDASDTAESENGFPASSPVPSPDREPLRPPEVHYKPKLILRGHKRGVAAVKFSPDGKWVASCCTFSFSFLSAIYTDESACQLRMLHARFGMRTRANTNIHSRDI